jgi:hypothetical protein
MRFLCIGMVMPTCLVLRINKWKKEQIRFDIVYSKEDSVVFGFTKDPSIVTSWEIRLYNLHKLISLHKTSELRSGISFGSAYKLCFNLL